MGFLTVSTIFLSLFGVSYGGPPRYPIDLQRDKIHYHNHSIYNELYTTKNHIAWNEQWQLYPATQRNCYQSGEHAKFETLLEAGYYFCLSSTKFIEAISLEDDGRTYFKDELHSFTSRNKTTGELLENSRGLSMSVIFTFTFELHYDNLKLLQTQQGMETCWELLKHAVLQCRHTLRPNTILDANGYLNLWSRGGVGTVLPRWSHLQPGREFISLRIDPNKYDPKLDEGRTA